MTAHTPHIEAAPGLVLETNPAWGPCTIAKLSKWRDTPFFAVACQHAAEVFAQRAALLPVTVDEDGIFALEYPLKGKLEFFFSKRIAGKEWHYRYHWNLDEEPQLLAELRLQGRWAQGLH